MQRKYGLYGTIASWVLGHRIAVSIAAAIIFVVAAVVGLPPKIDSHILSLLPDNEPVVVATKELSKSEGGANVTTLVFMMEKEEPTKDEMAAFHEWLDDVAVKFAELERVDFAVHRVNDELAFRLGLLQLDAKEITALTNRLRGAVALGRAMNPMLAQQLLDMKPLIARVQKAEENAFLQEDGRRGTVLIRPTGGSHDPQFATAFMKDAEALIDAVDPEANGASLAWFGGAYRHTNEDIQGLRSDLLWTSIASAILVLGFIVISFRSWKAPLLMVIPLGFANVVNLAFVAVWAGHLNTYTSMAVAVLIGLGVDFAVHLVGRYRELHASGLPIEEAIPLAWDATGPPCTTAALTSAAGFLALAAGSFLGFSQLGVVLATGLVLCLLSMLVLLPILLPIFDAAPRPLVGMAPGTQAASVSTYSLAPVGLMLAVIATALIGGTRLPLIGFNYDISEMRRQGQAYEELSDLERELAEKSYAPVIMSFPDRESLQAAHGKYQEMLAEEELRYVATAVSIENVLPLDQEERVKALGSLASVTRKPGFRALEGTAAKPIVGMLAPMRTYEPKMLTRDELPPAVLHLLGAGDADTFRMILIPKGNMWDLREAEKLKDEILANAMGATVAGSLVASGALYTMVQSDIPIIAILAIFLVIALTSIDVKRPIWIAGALFALTSGVVWAGAALQLIGVRLTIVNMVGIPILLGIGIDVVIHLLHRLTEEGPGGVRRALYTTGVAATVSTLTTIASFASLTLAGNRGIQGLGLLVVIGLAMVFIGAIIVLPLAWAAGWKVAGRAPADRLVEGEE